jgi:hypoxanthine phosphoribosyltransferase
MIEKCYVSWNEIDELVNSLTQQIAQSGIQIENIFGLQRGGLIPAVMVSHKLGIPMTKGTISPNTLIIDDICDSGVTFTNFFETHQKEYAFPFNLNFACLHYKPQTSKFKPTFYSSIWNSNDWIVYPWEREDSNTIQDYKF